MDQFLREYRLSAGVRGQPGFMVGERTPTCPEGLHISFMADKADTETANTAKISLWNLSPEQLAILNQADCAVELRAGYDKMIALVFAGDITFVTTKLDGADRETTFEAADGGVTLRDAYMSLSYSGSIESKTILDDIAEQMGVAVTYSHDASFYTFPSGFSVVGPASVALDKACASSGLSWQLLNGTLQIKRVGGTMSREVYVLAPSTGLIGIPTKIMLAANSESDEEEEGWEVKYLLNGAIDVNDFIRLESKVATGFFRVHSIEFDGDNLAGSWTCTARLLEER